MLPREKSVVGILTLAYLLAVTTSLKSLSVVPLALATTAYLLHLFTFDAIFYAKSRPRFYLLAAVNSLPYLAAAALGWWNATAYVVGFVLFAAYTALLHLGKGRAVEGVIVGTALLASLFLLVKAVVAQQLGLRDYLLYLLFVGYHVATAYYVESRLAFRDVRPHTALYIWAPVSASVVFLWPYLLIAVVEPSYKFLANVRSNVKYSRHEDIVKMGWRELTRACLFTAVLAVVYYL